MTVRHSCSTRLEAFIVTYLDWRQVIEEEHPRHVLALLYVSPLEVLCHRVLIAVDGVVTHIPVNCGHYLQKCALHRVHMQREVSDITQVERHLAGM